MQLALPLVGLLAVTLAVTSAVTQAIALAVTLAAIAITPNPTRSGKWFPEF